METLTDPINAWWLVSIGLLLIGLEMFMILFVLLFFGAGFVLVGIASFVWSIPAELQILSAFTLGGILTFLLRKAFIRNLSQAEAVEIETMQTGEVGKIISANGEMRVEYKGTTWALYDQAETLELGELVIVTELKNNKAVVRKKA